MNDHSRTTSVEAHLLGALIRDGLPLPDGIIPSDFAEPLNQEVAAALVAIAGKGEGIDDLTVSIALRDKKATAQAHYVNELTSGVGLTLLNRSWATELKRLANLRAIAAVTRKGSELAADPAADPEAIISFIDGTIKATTRKTEKSDSTSVPMSLDDLEAFDRKNDPDSVIGSRWLCKGGSCLLVSQSGVGKSSFSLQFMISLALKRSFFGIEAKTKLRVLFIQRENILGDVAEPFQDITAGMNLHAPERADLREQLFIYRSSRLVGAEFLAEMRNLILRHAAQVVIIDPLMAFAGFDVADQQEMTAFCRQGLDPILTETGVVLFAVHHTTKPRTAKDNAAQTPADLAYSGAGASEIVNYFREVAVLQRCPGEEPIFKFSLTKRRGRADLRDDMGDFAGEIFVRHSPQKGVIRWERSQPPAPADSDSDSRPAKGSRKQF